MLLNELFEVGANPAYLSAAERSLSQARDTQRQYWRSPEEKAAARRTELKREKGIAGYSKRHRAANPDMYPAAKSQPAPKLRDPSTEYSDDYSVWAAGRRDTMEQGVAEGRATYGPITDAHKAAAKKAFAAGERDGKAGAEKNKQYMSSALMKTTYLNGYKQGKQGAAEGHTK